MNPLKLPTSAVCILVAGLSFAAGYKAHEYSTLRLPGTYAQESARRPGPLSQATVCFTPGKQCQRLLIEQVNKSKKSIFMQAYSFTDPEVASALVRARQRGVTVSALLDKSNARNSKSAKGIIMDGNIPTRFDYPPGIAHSKVMVIDAETIVTGSYNFSAAAYKGNVENLLVITDKTLAAKYLGNWKRRWDLAREK